MIELGDDRPHALEQGQKIDHATGLVQRAAKFHGHAVVVTVQRLADAARQHNEVGRTVDQIVACDADRVIRHAKIPAITLVEFAFFE